MNTYADKAHENKSHSIMNAVSQKKSGGSPIFQFLDNRPEVIAQRKQQKMANDSPQVKQAAQLQKMADNYTAQQQPTIQKRKNNTGLPDNLKSGIEKLSGYSMDDVKVHYNSDKPAQLQAHAYAQGADIYLASGQEKHLPHEAWHVVQQKQGRVKTTMKMKGNVNINDDSDLEKEADVMGVKVLQMKTANLDHSDMQTSGIKQPTSRLSNIDVVQRSINLSTTIQNNYNLAAMRANRDETSGYTPPVVNGTEYNPGGAANWVQNHLLLPTITTIQGNDGIYRSTVTAVQANTLGYNMYLPTPPGPWNAVANKAATLGYYGIPPFDGTGEVNLVVEGNPDNATFIQQVRAHEDVHAADIERAINQILKPWDNALQQIMDAGTEFQGATQMAAENALWTAVGGDVAQICTNLNTQWAADSHAYHQTPAGGSDSVGTYDPNTNTVTLRVAINQPLAQGTNWLGLGTIVVPALIIGGLIINNLYGKK